eukprot:scaffold6925_cov248-Ochromonas_danica.AAC.8
MERTLESRTMNARKARKGDDMLKPWENSESEGGEVEEEFLGMQGLREDSGLKRGFPGFAYVINVSLHRPEWLTYAMEGDDFGGK